jgi:hypothetical protein
MKAVLAATLLTAGLALAVFLLSSKDGSSAAAPDYSWLDMRAIQEQSRRLDGAVEGARRFQATFQRAQEELLKGALTLGEAVDAVLESARYDNPQFMGWLQRNVPARDDRERVARHLLGRVQAIAEAGLLSPDQKESADCLRDEFEADLAVK